MGKENIEVQVRNLTKCLGDLKVLDHISFDARQGEFSCIVGPTGCGKIMLLNCLTKICDITDGEILVDGAPIDYRENNISYILQESLAMEWPMVEENIRPGPQIKRVPQTLLRERVEEVLEIVGLTEYRHYYPGQLSINALQRMVTAWASTTYPELLLMDEPYRQLDLDPRSKLEDELLKLWQKTKTTVTLITHNVEEAVCLGERITVLTNKPTGVKQILDCHLEKSRDATDREFVKVRNEVTDLICWW